MAIQVQTAEVAMLRQSLQRVQLLLAVQEFGSHALCGFLASEPCSKPHRAMISSRNNNIYSEGTSRRPVPAGIEAPMPATVDSTSFRVNEPCRLESVLWDADALFVEADNELSVREAVMAYAYACVRVSSYSYFDLGKGVQCHRMPAFGMLPQAVESSAVLLDSVRTALSISKAFKDGLPRFIPNQDYLVSFPLIPRGFGEFEKISSLLVYFTLTLVFVP